MQSPFRDYEPPDEVAALQLILLGPARSHPVETLGPTGLGPLRFRPTHTFPS